MRLALALLVLATPVWAKSPREALFPNDTACYLRQYSLVHLAGHPDQRVRQIALAPQEMQSRADPLVLRLTVGLRNTTERFSVLATCENTGGSLSCGVEGDGGWFTLEQAKNGLKMKVGRQPIGIEGETGFVSFGAGTSDDDVFLIPRAASEACAG